MGISKGTQLKNVETVDKSAPVIDVDTKVGKNKHNELFSDITKGASLKTVETVDKSAPVIEQDAKLRRHSRGDLLVEIKNRKMDAD